MLGRSICDEGRVGVEPIHVMLGSERGEAVILLLSFSRRLFRCWRCMQQRRGLSHLGRFDDEDEMRQRHMRGGEDQKWIEMGKPVLGSICVLWRALWTQGLHPKQGGLWSERVWTDNPKEKKKTTNGRIVRQ
jgi:hypothetical protein